MNSPPGPSRPTTSSPPEATGRDSTGLERSRKRQASIARLCRWSHLACRAQTRERIAPPTETRQRSADSAHNRLDMTARGGRPCRKSGRLDTAAHSGGFEDQPETSLNGRRPGSMTPCPMAPGEKSSRAANSSSKLDVAPGLRRHNRLPSLKTPLGSTSNPESVAMRQRCELALLARNRFAVNFVLQDAGVPSMPAEGVERVEATLSAGWRRSQLLTP